MCRRIRSIQTAQVFSWKNAVLWANPWQFLWIHCANHAKHCDRFMPWKLCGTFCREWWLVLGYNVEGFADDEAVRAALICWTWSVLWRQMREEEEEVPCSHHRFPLYFDIFTASLNLLYLLLSRVLPCTLIYNVSPHIPTPQLCHVALSMSGCWRSIVGCGTMYHVAENLFIRQSDGISCKSRDKHVHFCLGN